MSLTIDHESQNAPSHIQAIGRCRRVKEAKLKAMFSLTKLADDEVIIHHANLEEQLHRESLNITVQRSTEYRSLNEAIDMEVSGTRKRRLGSLIDKLSGLRELLRFQDEEREKDLSAKAAVRQKGKAFQIRQARLENKQNAERQELILAQGRLQETLTQIKIAKVNMMKDKQAARLKEKENEITAQQNRMRQQKGLQLHPRFVKLKNNLKTFGELQVCKIRHLTQLNDFDISACEDIEELMGKARQDEFNLNQKQSFEEKEAESEIEKQRLFLNKSRLLENQKTTKTQIMRQQRKQEKTMNKANRAAIKNREKTMIADNPIIRGELDGDNYDTMSEGLQSSLGSRSNSMHDTSSAYDAISESGIDNNSEAGDREIVEENNQEISGSNTALALANAQRNKIVSSADGLNDEDVELNRLLDSGRERLYVLRLHHRKTLKDLKSHHRSMVSQKQREHRRKLADLLKEHEDEIQSLKSEHIGVMEELFNNQLEKGSVLKDTENSQRLLGMMLPAHVIEDMENGVTPQPKSYEMVTIFFTDIPQFKSLASTVSSIHLLTFLNTVYARFDSIIEEYPSLYKVENVADTYMVAAGLSNDSDKDSVKEIAAATMAVAECTQRLLKSFQDIDFERFGLTEAVHLRVGVHTGPVLAGIIGTKMGRYCLFGDTVNTASRMCTTDVEGQIQVSPTTYQILRTNDPRIKFEERSDVQVKGKGCMTTYLMMG
ncbi:adenylate and guanylate cyclase catalytic domain-containing protein [Chytridium lagenaria]|nr:adenylate and guanylate cyclase catalytic domain-containing protein [Chytridium lagenaria]